MVYSVEKIKDLVLHTLDKYDVKKAALFGSIARGEATEKSDIDLLIEFKGETSLLDLSGLKLELQDILNCRVDVGTYNSLHPLIKTQILKEQIAIL